MDTLVSPWRKTILGMQMLFVAFGALVLVPLLTGLDPSIALFTAGVGTLIFHFITKNSVPVFLASSFAFIAPIQIGIQEYGISATLGGLASAGVVYMIIAGLIKLRGTSVVEKYLPPIVTGPVIMVIGLKLAPVAIGMTKNFDASSNVDLSAILVALVTLATTITVVLKGKGMLGLIPIFVGIVTGYVICLFMGVINFEVISNAPWFAIPWTAAIENGSYAFPTFDIRAILFILPVAIAPAIEHVGDVIAISSVTGNDYLEKPGLHRTILGDGIATSMAAFLGGPPNTTYSEVTGAVALLKRFDPVLMRIAAVFAVFLAFFSKLGAILKTIPIPVMGGIMVLLFGMIAAIGIGSLIKGKVNLNNPRNLVIVAVILVFGIGDMSLGYGDFKLAGIGLAGITGVILNIVLPKKTN
ncbi:MAG: uracil-xanthine permease [Melioribacteraceae bacterium]|nr:uracil-xanthine permease [Melioribacteraceae bacterium]